MLGPLEWYSVIPVGIAAAIVGLVVLVISPAISSPAIVPANSIKGSVAAAESGFS